MSTESPTVIEVVRSITVPLPQAKTFELFTARMTEFWPPEHSIGASPFVAVVLEPRVSGRWFERDGEGNECDWGRVGSWEPASRVVLLCRLTAEWEFDPDFHTAVEVTFEERAGRTTLHLRYGEHAERTRAIFDSSNGWTETLNRCARLAELQ